MGAWLSAALELRASLRRALGALGAVAILVCVGSSGGTHVAEAGLNAWSSAGPEGGTIHALAVDPLTPSTVYGGVFSQGVFKSVDSGGRWTLVLPASQVLALAIDPQTPNTIYAGLSAGG